MNVFVSYNSLLLKYPWPTKCLTTSFLFGLGDFITQYFIQKKENYDSFRTTKMALFGLVFAAPVLNVWYTNFMPKCANKIFSYNKLTPYATTNKKMLCGLFLDQTIFASYFLVCFFMIMDYTDTKNVKKAWENLQENFWPTMIVNWKIWPAAQLINFTIIPLHYRLLFANSVGLFWNCYLSYAQYRQEKYEKK